MKTKEIKLGSEVFYFDTFKVEKSNEHNFNIYTGKDSESILSTRLKFLFLILIIIKKLRRCAIN